MNLTAVRTLLLCTLFGLSSAALAKDAAKSEKPAKDDKAKKEAAKPINKICPVEGGEVDPEVTVTHKGKVVAFCCAGCDTEFQKDPAKYLAIIAKDPKNKAEGDKEGDDAKKEGAKKEGDDDHADKHEHDDADKAEGEKTEAKLNAKCPVSGDDADPKMTADYKGREVAFCCDECAKDFEKNPKKYLASLEAQDKAAAAEKDHDHDGDGKADHDEKDHKDEDHDDHEHEDEKRAEKAEK